MDEWRFDTMSDKPILKLRPLEYTVVHTPTQRDFDMLMRVYECGGWRWAFNGNSSSLPTGEISKTVLVTENVYLDAGCYNGNNGFFVWSHRYVTSPCDPLKQIAVLDPRLTFILPEEFYKIERVSLGQIRAINKYFDTRKS